MIIPRTRYPPGVPCFVDTEREDVDGAKAFYGGLFGWDFEERLPAGAPARFAIATLDGLSVAAIASASESTASPDWNTYVAVEDADAAAAKVEAAGGTVVTPPVTPGPAGRFAAFTDPQGAALRVWEAGANPGAQLVNAPGSWNWSDLQTPDPEAARAFYGDVFGWQFRAQDPPEAQLSLICMPGYDEFLERDYPGRLDAMAEMGAPEGFGGAIAWVARPPRDDPPSWAITFSVADADESARRGAELGGTIIADPVDLPWVRTAVLRDPDGVTFTIAQFKPPA